MRGPYSLAELAQEEGGTTEDGRIVGALANVRFTMSALDLFSGIELPGPRRLARDWWTSNGMGSVVCLCRR